MIVISDTNIIFSCFYTPNGAMATILKNEKNKLQFIAPSYLLEEVKEHLPILMERNHLTKKKALDILKEATKNIIFYDLEEIKKKNREKAAEIAKDIDPDDYLFIALHFETGHKIWTCDAKLANGLKEKGYDMCITTNEIREKTYKKKEQNFSPIREDFYKQKIVYQELTQGSCFYLDKDATFFVSNTGYLITGKNLDYLILFLNSKFIEFAFKKFYSVSLGGSGIRWLAQCIENLPIPLCQDSNYLKLQTEEEIENYIYETFDIDQEEINLINSF